MKKRKIRTFEKSVAVKSSELIVSIVKMIKEKG